MQKSEGYVLPNDAYQKDSFDMYSMNIGNEDVTEEQVTLIYTERIEQSYQDCSWRDMIFVLN